MDAGQVQAMLEAAQQIGITDWTAENLGEACDTGLAGVQCNSTGFITRLYMYPSLIGPAPDAFSALVALRTMTLNYNVNGTLPSSWSTLTQLESIVVGDYISSKQYLTGAIPESWSSMTSLASLQILFTNPQNPSTPLIASAPPSWLGNLESVTLANAYWPTSALPASIEDSTTLKTLSFTNCVFEGDFPISLLNNTLITSLSLGVAGISDFGSGSTLPSDFSGMTSLTGLSISGGSFTGSLPTIYPPTLTSLRFSTMSLLTGDIPQVIIDLPALTTMSLMSMPGITGPLPGPSNASASKLTQYFVNDMAFTGTIPSSILGLNAQLLFNNLPYITGPFPTISAESGDDCRVPLINFRNVSLAGTPFPIELVENCATLRQLTFFRCGLTGQIPDFTATPSFSGIELDNNPLGGTIPIITFAQKANVIMSSCNLTGVIPTFYLNSTAFSGIEFDGNKLDLCSNSAAVQATGFANNTEENCNLSGQTPSECGCPDIWPSRCFSTPMPGECLPPTAAPVPTLAPVSPPSTPSIPLAPTHSVPARIPSTPTNGAASSFTSFGYVLVLTVVMSLL